MVRVAIWLAAAAVLGAMLSLAFYMTALPHTRTETVTYCFGPSVEILGHGPMTDQDRTVIEQCGYGGRFASGSPTPR